MNKQEAIYNLFDERGELLEDKAIAQTQRRPFYLQSRLADLNDQVNLIFHITEEAQVIYFSRPTMAQPYTSYQPSAQELANRYDYTPTPSDMPVIDIDKVDEIKF